MTVNRTIWFFLSEYFQPTDITLFHRKSEIFILVFGYRFYISVSIFFLVMSQHFKTEINIRHNQSTLTLINIKHYKVSHGIVKLKRNRYHFFCTFSHIL